MWNKKSIGGDTRNFFNNKAQILDEMLLHLIIGAQLEGQQISLGHLTGLRSNPGIESFNMVICGDVTKMS